MSCASHDNSCPFFYHYRVPHNVIYLRFLHNYLQGCSMDRATRLGLDITTATDRPEMKRTQKYHHYFHRQVVVNSHVP